MNLLVNTRITKESSTGGVWEANGVSQDRGNLANFSKLEVLKYTLASLATAYPWNKAIIKVLLDEEYKNQESELHQFIEKEFNGIELHIFNNRNETQQDWIDNYELIKDSDFTLVYCTHDHVFMDHSSEYLETIIKDLTTNYPLEYITLATSHWSEFIRNAKAGPTNTGKDHPPEFYNIDYKLEKNYVSYKGHCYDSIHIYSKNLYEDFFLRANWDQSLNSLPRLISRYPSGHIELPRIDGVGITDLNFIRNKVLRIPTPQQKIVIPYKEITRHFDGYFYHGITNEQVPSLEIPPGFFEGQIKIRYGYKDRKKGWVNINPTSEHYYAADKSGVDYKFTLKELPAFWLKRISKIDVNPNINKEEEIQYRLKTVLERIYTSPNHNPFIDDQLKDNILNKYLELFPEYSILQ